MLKLKKCWRKNLKISLPLLESLLANASGWVEFYTPEQYVLEQLNLQSGPKWPSPESRLKNDPGLNSQTETEYKWNEMFPLS